MGQKVHPKAFRLGIVKEWDCSWFASAHYAEYVMEDFKIRKYIKKELYRTGVSRIVINRKSDLLDVRVSVARTGIIFGRKGVDLSAIKNELKRLLNKRLKINITIIEEKRPEANARLLGEWIVGQLERRVPFRRAMKIAVQKALKAGTQGIKVSCAGRLGGAEIARRESYREGKVPLHTIRADIDYAFSEALTTYGKIGVKVWLYHGEIFERPGADIEETAVGEKIKK